MGFNFNIFRILGDVSHVSSKCILIWAIHTNRSAEGVSLLTQLLYVLVFCARYLDIFYFDITDWHSMWNFVLKIFFVSSSLYIIFLMMRVFARTREREKAWKLGAYSLLGSVVSAPLMYWIFKKYAVTTGFMEILWTFSIELEAFCILPQLLLLRQTTVPTVIDSFYLVTLGSYRGFYILNWIVRLISEGNKQPVAWIFGIIQTAFYIDFAWVYWTRQRVKLRAGGVVDSDDMGRGYLISKILGGGRRSQDFDEDEGPDLENGGEDAPRRGGRWGARGVSVSADDDVHDIQQGETGERQPLTDPDAFADEESDLEAESSRVVKREEQKPGADVGNGSEWRDDEDRK